MCGFTGCKLSAAAVPQPATHTAQHPTPAAGIFKFDFEEQDLDEATVRRLVWREMQYYQQEAA